MIVRKLQAAGHTAYFAGGCVRDMLREAEPHDYDVATSATPAEVEALFPGRADLVGKSFGVVIVRLDGVHVEVATFRVDGTYLDGRRPDSVQFSTPEEDAKRRDFTVNALFYDPVEDRVIDYVGGRADLEARILRAVGEPRQRFEEDRLRVLRAIRFVSALGFQIEPNTWAAVKESARAVTVVSPERIRDELSKWLVGEHRCEALDLLSESGILMLLLPEVEKMKGVEQPPQFHPEGDVFVHTRLVLSHLRQPGYGLAWAALLHDIGKPPTFSVDETGRFRFNGHETVGARMAQKILSRLRFSNADIEAITAMIANHMSFKDVPQMRVGTLKKLMARDTFADEIELHRADCLGSHGDLGIYDLLRERRAAMSVEEVKPEPWVRGADVLALGMTPGPSVGCLLKAAYDQQLEGVWAGRENALEWLRSEVAQSLSSRKQEDLQS